MNGGLGNQIFQYVFFRWLEVETGESCIIDAYGNTLAQAEGNSQQTVSATIDMERQRHFREKFPVLRERDILKDFPALYT